MINNTLRAKISIGQILIEFHDGFYNNGQFKTQQAVDKLKQNGFEIFAIFNSFEEISFINKNVIRLFRKVNVRNGFPQIMKMIAENNQQKSAKSAGE